MNAMNLLDHSQLYIGKTVTFTNKAFTEQDAYCEAGMKGNIVGMRKTMHGSISVSINYGQFRYHNLTLESAVWYMPMSVSVTSEQRLQGTATQCGYYNEEDTIDINYTDQLEDYFSIDADTVNLQSLYTKYKIDNQSYIQWLESIAIEKYTQMLIN